jgi:antitoxin component of MazEF toxin-antitoxin module
MTSVTVRQSGGAEIVTIPKAIGNALGIKKDQN